MRIGSARFRGAWCLAALLAGWAPALPDAEAATRRVLLIEGFEEISRVRAGGGRLTAAVGGGGVTEGRQAATLGPGTSLTFAVPTGECRRYDWLKMDTLTLQPLAHRFLIRAEARGLSFRRHCYVRAGRDTLALPLSWPVARLRGRWPTGRLRLTITSAGDAPVIVDNLRLTLASPPPPGAVLRDFGSDRQLVWPGFEGAEAESEEVIWSGETAVRAYADRDFPDPLSADFVGPALRGGPAGDNFSLLCPARSGRAWLWVTHFTALGPPAAYAVKVRGRTVLRKKLTRRQMLGPEGLFEGMGGDWTPEWYDRTYAGRFADVVKVDLVAGRNRIDLDNCQLAALAVAAAPQAAELADYVEKVRADLSRFRRQFLVGARIGPRCDLSPTRGEQEAGIMVFQPPLDGALGPGWQPQEGHRAKLLRAVVANGDAEAMAVAAAPLKATAFLRADLGPLRTRDGHRLPTDRRRTGAWFCRPVPRVLDAAAQFQPWVIARRCGKLAERELACLLVTVAPAEDAAAGTYGGVLELTAAGGKARVPVEVRVVDVGPQAPSRPAVGALGTDGRARGFYLSLCAGLSEAAEDALSREVRRRLLSDALNSLHLRAAELRSRSRISDARLRRDLKAYPSRLATGRTLFDLTSTFRRLENRRIGPGTRRYRAAVAGAVGKTAALARRAGVHCYYFYVGRAESAKQLPGLSRRASTVRSAGGSAIARVALAAIRATGEKDRRRVLTPFRSLIFRPNGPNLGESLKLFKSLGRGRKAYVWLQRPDRYGAGLYAAACGADGVYVSGVASDRPLYNGFLFDGRGVLALQPDKTLAPTLAMFALRQGVRDFLLVRRAEALAARAEKAKADAAGLEKALAELRVRVARDAGPAYDRRLARSPRMAPSEIRSWRVRLIIEAGKAARNLQAGRGPASGARVARGRRAARGYPSNAIGPIMKPFRCPQANKGSRT